MVHLPGKKGNNMRQSAGSERALVVCFVALVLFTIAFRSQIGTFLFGRDDAFVADYTEWLNVCIGAGRPCLRTVTALMGQGFEGVFGSIAGLFYWDVSSSAFFKGSPWDTKDLAAETVRELIVPVIAYVALVLVLLYPVLVTCHRLFDGLAQRLFFLLVAFSVLIGWHPSLINVFFDFATLFIDWPRSYYLFSQEARHYDFGAISVTLLALLYLARPGPRSRAVLFIFAAFAQATMENLGVVFAVAVFFASLNAQPRLATLRSLRRPLAEMFSASAGAVSAAVLLSAMFYLFAGNADPEATIPSASTGFLSDAYRGMVQNNFDWIRTITANVVSMTIFPVLGGIAIGIMTASRRPLADETQHQAALAAAVTGAGLVVGLLLTVAIGLFFVAYPAEMGRQLLPLAIIAIVPAARFSELAIYRLRNR